MKPTHLSLSFSVRLVDGLSEPADQATLISALLDSPVSPASPVECVSIDRHREVQAPYPPPPALIAQAKRVVSWEWNSPSYRQLSRAPRVVKLSGFTDAIHSAEHLLELLAPLPWTWMASGSLDRSAWGSAGAVIEYLDAPSFGDGHFGHGWVCGFRGEGHRQLVSRRWLDHGPWRVLRGDHDTTLVEFHPMEAEPMRALEFARPGHARMGISKEGGFIPSRPTPWQFPHLRNTYDPDKRELIVVVMGRDVPPVEMLEACAIRLHQPLEVPVDNVTYVFMEEARARAHLHDLWLRELGCRALIDGREVDLMEGYEPGG